MSPKSMWLSRRLLHSRSIASNHIRTGEVTSPVSGPLIAPFVVLWWAKSRSKWTDASCTMLDALSIIVAFNCWVDRSRPKKRGLGGVDMVVWFLIPMPSNRTSTEVFIPDYSDICPRPVRLFNGHHNHRVSWNGWKEWEVNKLGDRVISPIIWRRRENAEDWVQRGGGYKWFLAVSLILVWVRIST